MDKAKTQKILKPAISILGLQIKTTAVYIIPKDDSETERFAYIYKQVKATAKLDTIRTTMEYTRHKAIIEIIGGFDEVFKFIESFPGNPDSIDII